MIVWSLTRRRDGRAVDLHGASDIPPSRAAIVLSSTRSIGAARACS